MRSLSERVFKQGKTPPLRENQEEYQHLGDKPRKENAKMTVKSAQRIKSLKTMWSLRPRDWTFKREGGVRGDQEISKMGIKSIFLI